MSESSLPWLSLFLLGAAHGINPAMGWLFAVARGLQLRDRRAVWRALGPLAVGHALAIAVVASIAIALGRVLPIEWLRWSAAGALIIVGVDGLVRHRHRSLGGMRVSGRELATWSFLVASVHGAGVMVLPFVLGAATGQGAVKHHHHGTGWVLGTVASVPRPLYAVPRALGIMAPLIHTLGYVAITALIAVVIYERVGLGILRRAWINLDVLWGVALTAVGVLTVVL